MQTQLHIEVSDRNGNEESNIRQTLVSKHERQNELMRIKGKLINWHDDKGFGFIAPNGGHKHVFIHKKALCNKNRVPKVSDTITFSVAKDGQGRDCASEATFSGEKLKKKQAKKLNVFSLFLSIWFLLILFFEYHLSDFPKNLLLLYAGLSLVTFVAYAFDKSNAKKGAWRTKESTLHMLSLSGGWPGAALAQQFLRHKSSKKQFQITYWFTVVINIGALGWLLTTDYPILSMFSTLLYSVMAFDVTMIAYSDYQSILLI